PPEYASYAAGSFLATVAGMPRVFAHYLRLLVVPWPLCANYLGVFEVGADHGLLRWASVALLAAVLAGVTLLLRRRHLIGAGGAWFLVALGPVANLLPLPVPVAERFLYLPLIGVAITLAAAAAWASERWGRRAEVALAITGAAIGVVFVGLA